MKKAIIKFHCLCTKNWLEKDYSFFPKKDCIDCKGTGFYERDYPNVAGVIVIKEGE